MKMQITKKIVDEMMAELKEVTKKLGAKYGLEISCPHASYNNTSIDFKVRAEDPQANWDYFVTGTRLKPEDLGKVIVLGGKTMKIRGWDHTAKTNKIRMVECATGDLYCASVNTVADALQSSAATSAAPSSDTADAEDPEEAKKRRFETIAWYMGIKGKVEYGQIVTVCGTQLKLVDINRRAPKHPLIALDEKSGKKYKLSLEDVEASLAVTAGRVTEEVSK